MSSLFKNIKRGKKYMANKSTTNERNFITLHLKYRYRLGFIHTSKCDITLFVVADFAAKVVA